MTLPAILSFLFALGPAAGAPAAAPAELTRALTAGGGTYPDPAVMLPELTWVLPEEAEQAWRKVKHLVSPAAQAAAIRRGGIEQLACRDLIDFKEVAKRAGADFQFRDAFRGRSWARPALARLLVRSLDRFRQEYPQAALSVGDIAQPGCGQVAYGTLVQQWRADPADEAASQAHQRLRQSVRRVLGEPTVVEEAVASDFPLETDRFTSPATPILIERRVLGHSGWDAETDQPALLRTATRRSPR